MSAVLELTRLDQELAALDLDALRDEVSHQVMELAVKPTPKRAKTKHGPSANQRLGDLVSSLARAGWGVLEGREWRPVRSILEALARMMRDAKSDFKATITTTVRQLMDQSGYKDRQTRNALHWMEDMGLIVWWRGGVVEGKPQPGVLRVVKTKLVEWIKMARPIHDEAERRHRDETARRLRRLHFLRMAPRLPRSLHAAGSADLSSLRERAGAPNAPAPSHTPRITDKETIMSPTYTPTYETKYLPQHCFHGSLAPETCNECIRYAHQETTTAHALALRDAQEQAANDARRARAERAAAQKAAELEYETYMVTMYPNLTGRQRVTASAHDPQAQRLARACGL